MGRGSGRRHGGGTASRLPVRIGTPATEVGRRRSDEGPARSGEDPAEVRRRSGKSPAKVRRQSGGGPAATEAEATATKRKDTLNSDTMLRIKKIGIEINLPCV